MSIDWDRCIRDAVEKLPAKFRSKIANVAILLEDEPSKEVRAREGLRDGETLLGLYQGIPLSERGDGYGVGETLPDTITIYTKPTLEEAGDSPEAVARVVEDTVWHEFGHYFGLDEDEVRRRERERI